jgi:ABC-type thiamine transport system ATPase subunit
VDSWRRQIAWVPQRPHLFAGTVAANIALGQPDASAAAIERAEQAAGAAEFIEALSVGYDTPLGDRAGRLSAGQRQRIALARAFLRDAPLLLLDESAAHLDPVTERLILDTVETVMAGRTVVLVSHDPSWPGRAGRVIALDHGRIVPSPETSNLVVNRVMGGAHEDQRRDLVRIEDVARLPGSLSSHHLSRAVPGPGTGGSRAGEGSLEGAGAGGAVLRLLWLAGPLRGRLLLAVLAGAAATGCGVALLAVVAVRALSIGRGCSATASGWRPTMWPSGCSPMSGCASTAAWSGWRRQG